ncbi:YifB family Mg chelatase-like AAA ATPase [Actinomyces sp. B33]|uniref:YifB family Mg chelatase-like AAA ATPase n=1 Tax=Actinomyces sp. B33 TaxID=2942131 RepID=UPI002340F07B|nr:YifB family Mg chelatase-like AAA ATPase [Actinomyces sp. B33]MDC4232958.1 YifB family Mg chelatase-like AAA ATPase [Actinomyces sp. B33]
MRGPHRLGRGAVVSADALAVARSVALIGLEGALVDVETHVGRGMVAFTLVGLPDASLRESKERVRSALQSCGLEVLDSRVTVNLSPAGLPKSGSGFDAAIAASVLIAAGSLPPGPFDGAVLIAELGLDGSMRPVRGILPALIAARSQGIDRAVVASDGVDEAALIPGMDVVGFDHLADLVAWAGGKAARPRARGSRSAPAAEPARRTPEERGAASDLADVRGQNEAIGALEVAAAGGHHLFLVGEPGAGKTMLASRLVTILPELDDATALTSTSLHSLAGELGTTRLIRRPPLQAPHHSATMASLIGGGTSVILPGAASLAHGGVLLLDEAAEFSPSVLDALRQPLEDGEITIHRSKIRARYPAKFQLVLASNPCPCGGSTRARPCTCSSLARRRYMSRLSGPLLDRIDITVAMRAPTRADLAVGPGPSSAQVRERVSAARQRARHRLASTPWRVNAELPGRWLRTESGIDPRIVDSLDRAVDRGTVSMRGADRVLRLMWTLADLDGRPAPDQCDVARALQLRTGGPHGDL